MKVGISLIIPAYSNRMELHATLESLRRIELPNKRAEIIIIDGGKVPVTTKLEASEWTGITEVEYINEPDNGTYDAMNKGILLSKYEWMWFLNSGDEAINGPTNAAMATQKNLIVGSWITAEGTIISPSKEKGLSAGVRSEIGCGLCHQAMLFNRNRFGRRMYDHKKYSLAGELDFFYSAIDEEDYYLDNSFIVRYDNRRGLSKAKAVEHLRQSVDIYRKNGFSISKRRLLRRYLSAQWNELRCRIRS